MRISAKSGTRGASEMNFDQTLQRFGGSRVYFDTNVFAYFFGDTHPFVVPSAAMLRAAESGAFEALTGEVTIAELLVKPIAANDVAEISRIRRFFDDDELVHLLQHRRPEFELMAQIRATQRLKPMDALHAATAISQGCKFLVTGDVGFAGRVSGITAIDLNALVTNPT